MTRLAPRLGLAGLLAASGLVAFAASADDDPPAGPTPVRWRQHDVKRPKPPVVEPAEASVASKPPQGAVVLFDGHGLDAWKSASGGPAEWKVVDGCLQTVPGAGLIETKAKFGDVQLHVEWSAPDPPRGVGQDRGNSGIFLPGRFEVQVLDSYHAETYADGQAGAIYGQYPPLFNATRPPGAWQAYDVAFRRPRFDAAGKLLAPARLTVFLNGVLVQNNEEPFGPTSWLKWLPYEDVDGGRGPLSLQDHDHPVRYRNVWLVELPERPAPTPKDLARPAVVTLPADVLDRYTGQYLLNTRPDAPKVTFAREGNRLTVTFPFRPGALALEPTSETEFDMPFTDGRFTFRRDGQGRVTGAHFRIGDGERELKKVAP